MLFDNPLLALVPWYGTKRTLAPYVIEQMGPHSAYFAPFCGSMAVELAKQPCKYELVNDLHGDIINLADVIRDDKMGAKLYRWLRRTMVTETVFRESAALFERDPDCTHRPDLERAYHFFVCSWLGMNGVAGLWPPRTSFCARFAIGGGTPGVRWERAVRSIPWWRNRMRKMMVMCRDGFQIIARIEDKRRIVIYVDPPYLKKSASYRFDFTLSDEQAKDPLVKKYGQHGLLARMLGRFTKTRVIVSYYNHPALAELYPSWTKLEYKAGGMSNSIIGKKSGEKSDKQEVLLINGASYSPGLFDSLDLSSGSEDGSEYINMQESSNETLV